MLFASRTKQAPRRELGLPIGHGTSTKCISALITQCSAPTNQGQPRIRRITPQRTGQGLRISRPQLARYAPPPTPQADNFRFALITLLSPWIELFATRLKPIRDFYTYPAGVQLKDGQEFEYIVVGAGAGGAVAASRLALAGRRVLLVEAGGDPNVFTKVPGVTFALLGSEFDWKYQTLPNNVSCLSSVDKQCSFARGKGLGGSTSINYMIYTRGNRVDYDQITTPGWRYDDLMPYFLRFEGLNDLDLDELPLSSIPYHNTTGPLNVGFFGDSENPWHSRLIGAFRSLKFPFNKDVNGKSQIGVTQVLGYVHNGERMSTARAYLARKDVKAILTVAKNTMCTGVIIDNNRVARGITVVQRNKTLKLYAQKEVILSAGTIGTPQILMLSGVGPAEHLRDMDIPVKVDLPVGYGMTDHVLPLLMLRVKQDWRVHGKIELQTSKVTEVIELLVANQGPFTTNGLTDVSVFANTYCYDFSQRTLLNESSNGSDCEVPNLQIIHAYVDRQIISLFREKVKQSIRLNDFVIDQLSQVNEDSGLIMVLPVLLTPKSEGYVQLARRNPLARPAIYPNYLGDDRDVEEMVRSIRIIEQLTWTSTLRRHNVSVVRLDFPECPHYEEAEKGYWRCYVRHMTYAVYHAAGTASLGRVLDPQLRVLGVRGLRVADLSAIPRVPRGNTEAVSVAIGERVVDFLLEEELDTFSFW